MGCKHGKEMHRERGGERTLLFSIKITIIRLLEN